MTVVNTCNEAKYSEIRSVVLDYAQVLCLPPTLEEVNRMAQIFQLEADDFCELYVSSRAPYDRGAVTAAEYWTNFAHNAGVEMPPALLRQVRRWDTEMWSKTNTEMVQWLAMLHAAGLRTALLSNMEPDGANYARKNFSWFAYFNHTIFSCDIGLIKPDLAIFRECIRRIGVTPEETLFVDDRDANVEAAQTAGIKAIRFKSVTQLRTDLQKSGFSVLPGTAS